MIDYVKQIEELQQQFINQFQNSYIKPIEELQQLFINQFQNSFNIQSNLVQMKAWRLNAEYLVELLNRQNNFCRNVVNSSFNALADGNGIKDSMEKSRENYMNALKEMNEANVDSMNTLFAELGDLYYKMTTKNEDGGDERKN